MAGDLTTLDAILKDDYKDDHDQLNHATWTLNTIEEKSDTTEGRLARHALHTSRNTGVSNRGETVNNVPAAAGNQGYVSVPVVLRWIFARIQLTGQLIRMARTNTAAFLDAVDAEMNGAPKDAMKDVNRQTWGTSNGVIAQCGVTSGSTTVVLAANTTPTQVRQLYFDGGMRVDIGTVATPTSVATNRAVTGFALTAPPTITISGANVTTAGTDFIFRTGNGGATDNSGTPDDGQYELTGFQTHVKDDGILHTVNPATVPSWKSQEYSNGGNLRSLNESLVTGALMNNAVISGKSVRFLVSNVGVHLAAQAILISAKRIMNTVELGGGYSGIEWNAPGVQGGSGQNPTLFCEGETPEQKLYGLNTDELVAYTDGHGWEWVDDDGSVLSRVASGAWAFEALMVKALEIANHQRNAHFVINDVQQPAGVTPD